MGGGGGVRARPRRGRSPIWNTRPVRMDFLGLILHPVSLSAGDPLALESQGLRVGGVGVIGSAGTRNGHGKTARGGAHGQLKFQTSGAAAPSPSPTALIQP